jgi:hypothetical protein
MRQNKNLEPRFGFIEARLQSTKRQGREVPSSTIQIEAAISSGCDGGGDDGGGGDGAAPG